MAFWLRITEVDSCSIFFLVYLSIRSAWMMKACDVVGDQCLCMWFSFPYIDASVVFCADYTVFSFFIDTFLICLFSSIAWVLFVFPLASLLTLLFIFSWIACVVFPCLSLWIARAYSVARSWILGVYNEMLPAACSGLHEIFHLPLSFSPYPVCICSSKKQTEAERQKIVSEFEQLHQFLKDQEQLLLARLGELEREFVKSQEEKSSEVSKGISVLNKVIADLEEKCQQPASDFLQVRHIINPVGSLSMEGKGSASQRTIICEINAS